jgi:hypothetical protein
MPSESLGMKPESYELTRAIRDIEFANRRGQRCFKAVFLVTLGAIIYNVITKASEKERGR